MYQEGIGIEFWIFRVGDLSVAVCFGFRYSDFGFCSSAAEDASFD
jgi:hypothetical protein